MRLSNSRQRAGHVGKKIADQNVKSDNADASRGATADLHARSQPQSHPADFPRTSSSHSSTANENHRPAKTRTGIVSVNGQDVGIIHCHRP
jgi:hypothetical protein